MSSNYIQDFSFEADLLIEKELDHTVRYCLRLVGLGGF
jgi:hypothetical protein